MSETMSKTDDSELAIGQKYGPGNVTAPISLCKAAVSLGLVGSSVGMEVDGTTTDGPRKPRKAIHDLDLTSGSDKDVRFIVLGLTSGVPEVQRYIIDHYTMPDIEFVNPLGAVRGRENFYQVYRFATTMFHYHVNFRDVILEKLKAAVWLDLRVRPRNLPFLSRLILPTVVIMHFAVDPADGRTKMSYQVDHYSLFLKTWYGGVLAQQLQECLVRPLLGKLLVVQGTAMDYVLERLPAMLKPGTSTAAGRAPSSPHTNSRPLQNQEPASPLLNGHDDEDDDRVRQVVAALEATVVEVEDDSGWQSRGLVGKTVQAVLSVVGVGWVLTLAGADFALAQLQLLRPW